MRAFLLGAVLLLGVSVGVAELVMGAALLRDYLRSGQGAGSGGIGAVSAGCSGILPVAATTALVVAAAIRSGRRGRVLLLGYVCLLPMPFVLLYGGVFSRMPSAMLLLPGCYLLIMGLATLAATWLIARSGQPSPG